ncbi:MAG: RNA-binding protein [Alphaproteobacteria bacterium]|nr:RNA-binding protein [Alphaproteobacteria bacterium]
MPADDLPETDGPLRRCIVSGRTGPRASFVRFVLGPDSTVVPDLAGKLPGRGLWVSADAGSIRRAADKNAFAKAARASAKVPADLPERVGQLLTRRAIETLALCRRAGQAAQGFEKTKEAIAKGRCGLLVAASDGSPAERARIGGAGIPVASGLTAVEMGEAFGREHAVHAAIASGNLAERLREDLARLAAYRAAGSNA